MLYCPVLQLQPVVCEIVISLRISRIGDVAPEIVDRSVRIRQRCVRIALYALPCRLRNWRCEQGGIDHHSLGLEETGAAHAQGGRYMPSPPHLAVRIVLRAHMERTFYPYFFRRKPHVNHQPAHFVSSRPATVVGIEERNARWRNSKRIAGGRVHRVEDLLGFGHR